MSTESPYHHPDQPVRHSYPLVIEKAGLGTAIGLLRKTMPYAIVRFGILFGVSIVSILWLGGTFGGAAWLGDKVHPWIGTGWLFGGLGVYGWVFWTILRYILYMIKCGHIAVITELITKGEIANGEKGMFQYGKDIVSSRFKEVNVLFAMDLLISGVIKAFNRTLEGISNFIPIPGLEGIAKVVGMILHAMTTFVDETIFSYGLARGDDNPWRSGRDGLVYYAQNAKGILKTSLGIVVLEKVLVGLSWLVCLVPAFLIAKAMPGSNFTIAMFVVAALFAWNIKEAFLHPLFLIMIMTKFHVSVKGQAIDSTWEGRLDSASHKFGQIKTKMKEWVSPAPAPAPAVVETPPAV